MAGSFAAADLLDFVLTPARKLPLGVSTVVSVPPSEFDDDSVLMLMLMLVLELRDVGVALRLMDEEDGSMMFPF